MSARIAIVDDERRLVDILSMLLGREGYEVVGFSEPAAFLARVEEPFDLVLTDLKMPGHGGLEILSRVKAANPDVPVVLMTAHAEVRTAIEAMKLGAFDYVEKPFDNDALRALIRRALEHTQLARENRYLRAELAARYDLAEIIAESPGMQAVLEIVRRVARSKSTVLIEGGSGAGKEMVARAIHFHSDRVGRPFVAVNCKAFAAGVLESELFGHEKGAFTGAERARAGVFERADGGTLFLDEIGEIDEAFQAKLLRVLQERRVMRVGGDEERAIDVRVLSATNRELRAEVDAGRFREDLYFRLAVIPVRIPPLAERREDVLPLARHFLARAARELARPIEGWTDGVEAALLAHPWPGNVRELENAMERAAVLAREARITPADLQLGPGRSAASEPGSTLAEFLDHAATERIRAVLAEVGGVRMDAAARLGIERTTLYRLMKKYGLD